VQLSSWHSYPSIFALGHKGVEELLLDSVVIEEKIDGSQFSFGLIDGVLRFRSKGQEIFLDANGGTPAGAGMFSLAIASVRERLGLLTPEWTYRCEFLSKPKHNTLVYDRVPLGNLIIFDIASGQEEYRPANAKLFEAQRLGLECVPLLFEGYWQAGNIAGIEKLLETPSILGGQKVEGIVIKNYARFGRDKKVLIGKYVSEAFKEVHRGDWKERNVNREDFVLALGGTYTSAARWNKAIQHLSEAGLLEGSPRDIGLLIKEVPEDILKEHREEIRDQLFNHFWPNIRRQTVKGLAEFYKDQLLRAQFTEAMTEVDMVDPRPRLRLPEGANLEYDATAIDAFKMVAGAVA
jgi:hypothetical protein